MDRLRGGAGKNKSKKDTRYRRWGTSGVRHHVAAVIFSVFSTILQRHPRNPPVKMLKGKLRRGIIMFYLGREHIVSSTMEEPPPN